MRCSFCTAGGGMGGATGVPLAIGAMMILKKAVTDYGVFAPEGILDPDMFFRHSQRFVFPEKKTWRSWF